MAFGTSINALHIPTVIQTLDHNQLLAALNQPSIQWGSVKDLRSAISFLVNQRTDNAKTMLDALIKKFTSKNSIEFAMMMLDEAAFDSAKTINDRLYQSWDSFFRHNESSQLIALTTMFERAKSVSAGQREQSKAFVMKVLDLCLVTKIRYGKHILNDKSVVLAIIDMNDIKIATKVFTKIAIRKVDAKAVILAALASENSKMIELLLDGNMNPEFVASFSTHIKRWLKQNPGHPLHESAAMQLTRADQYLESLRQNETEAEAKAKAEQEPVSNQEFNRAIILGNADLVNRYLAEKFSNPDGTPLLAHQAQAIAQEIKATILSPFSQKIILLLGQGHHGLSGYSEIYKLLCQYQLIDPNDASPEMFATTAALDNKAQDACTLWQRIKDHLVRFHPNEVDPISRVLNAVLNYDSSFLAGIFLPPSATSSSAPGFPYSLQERLSVIFLDRKDKINIFFKSFINGVDELLQHQATSDTAYSAEEYAQQNERPTPDLRKIIAVKQDVRRHLASNPVKNMLSITAGQDLSSTVVLLAKFIANLIDGQQALQVILDIGNKRGPFHFVNPAQPILSARMAQLTQIMQMEKQVIETVHEIFCDVAKLYLNTLTARFNVGQPSDDARAALPDNADEDEFGLLGSANTEATDLFTQAAAVFGVNPQQPGFQQTGAAAAAAAAAAAPNRHMTAAEIAEQAARAPAPPRR